MNQLFPVGLAAITAAVFGIKGVIVRRYMGNAAAFTGAMVSAIVGSLTLGAFSLFFSDWGRLERVPFLWFAAAGAMAPGISLPTLYLGIHRIGVGRMMPLATLCPFFSIAIAMVWLGERPGPLAFLATALVIVGCVLTSLKPERDSGWSRMDLWIPVVHALSVAISASMRRHALLVCPEALAGATIATAAAALTIAAVRPLLPAKEGKSLDRRELGFFALLGLFLAVSFLAHFAAYLEGDVSVVMPIVYSAPLFAIVLARIWIPDQEVITWQKTSGALAIFAGVVVMAAYAA